MSGPITTYTNPSSKPFAWSYSKLKNYEVCPKRHFHFDIAKDVKEPESQELKDGNFVHKTLADRISKGTPLPAQVAQYEPWAVKILNGAKPDPNSKSILVEQQLAIRRDFSPCAWFGKNEVWFRGIGDVIKIFGPVALVIDWKTGKIKEDQTQLMSMAQCVFSHHPQVQKVRSEFVWLGYDATTRMDFARADMPGHWASVLPRVALLEQAAQTMTYPAKPGGLCKRWCAVTSCPHHGE
jgi:hypothetical protein